MRPIATPVSRVASAAVVLVLLLPTVLSHGGHEAMDMDAGLGSGTTIGVTEPQPELELPQSYFAHPEYRGILLAHIGLMVLAWVLLLPLATMFSLARSRYRAPTQFLFLATNALGVLLSTIYNAKTPDLYPNNAHHKLGWLVTWVLSAQVVVGLVGRVAGAFNKSQSEDAGSNTTEHRSFIPISQAAMDEHHRFHSGGYSPLYRTSNDSGQGTERNTESLRSHSVSSNPDTLASPIEGLAHKEFAEDDEDLEAHSPALPSDATMHSLSAKVGSKIGSRAWQGAVLYYQFVDRTSMLLGFITLATGIITLARFFEGSHLFTGLAHWIKGGVFFWLGVITLGRWAGSFGDLGWAWNIRPKTAKKQWTPTAEFVESFLIFFYGSTNIFLEHLGNWGGEWSFEDLEHISITVLFLGGGLCGMLIESTRIRDLLNTTVTTAIDENYDDHDEREVALSEPATYGFSTNPIPALVILLLGIMMSSHTQQSMVSSMVHKQWGTMLTGASFARGLTYVLVYLKPPTSILPSRPPTELLTAFGLITGGIIFMASSGDTVAAMEHNNLDAMFFYTVTMGFVGLFMAWEIILIAVKGWAVRKEAGRPLVGRFHSA